VLGRQQSCRVQAAKFYQGVALRGGKCPFCYHPFLDTAFCGVTTLHTHCRYLQITIDTYTLHKIVTIYKTLKFSHTHTHTHEAFVGRAYCHTMTRGTAAA